MRSLLGLLLLGMAALGCGLATNDSTSAADDKSKGALVEFDGLQSRAPSTWKEEEVKGALRYMQFKLPKAAGDERDAELVIFKGIGGSAKENIERWKGQFKEPAGKNSESNEMDIGKAKAVYLDIKGVYLEKFPPFAPNAKITERPDYRMLAVHFEGDKNPYHIKLIGPAKTVEQYRKGFDEWLKAFK